METKAFPLAFLIASFSLTGALLAAVPIRWATSSGSSAPDTATPVPEIVASPALVEQGQQYFAMSCSECHGDDAHGDEGPDLHNLAISNARIAATIRHGVKGEMPTFAKKYNDAQLSALVSYLRSLR